MVQGQQKFLMKAGRLFGSMGDYLRRNLDIFGKWLKRWGEKSHSKLSRYQTDAFPSGIYYMTSGSLVVEFREWFEGPHAALGIMNIFSHGVIRMGDYLRRKGVITIRRKRQRQG